jgi:hypothetical protein
MSMGSEASAGRLHDGDELVLRRRDDGSVLLGDRRIDTLGLLAVELRECREAGARECVLATRPRETRQ